MNKPVIKAMYIVCLCLTVTALARQAGIYSYARQRAAQRVVNNEVNLNKNNSNSNKEIKKIALTFDDGPHPTYTEKLLDGLKERKVKASFFVTGEHVELHKDIIKRMANEGHLIGNHTYSHMQLTKSNKEKFEQELVKTNQLITDITNKEVEYVRPPYGTWDKSLEVKLNMLPVFWTVDPLDWCTDDVSGVARAVVSKAGENDIILLHDYYESSVDAALIVVDEMLKQGYTFVTVDEILFD